MTEAEWLECTDPQKMMEFLRGKASEREIRLLHSACCRRIWEFFPGERSRHAVQVVERYSDGHTNLESLRAAADAAVKVWLDDEPGFAAPAATASLWKLQLPPHASATDDEPLEMAQSVVRQLAFEGKWVFAGAGRENSDSAFTLFGAFGGPMAEPPAGE